MISYLNGLKLNGTDFCIKTQSYTFDLFTNKHTSISAQTVKGYKFAFWLQSATYDCAVSSYIENPSSSNTNVWLGRDKSDTENGGVSVWAIYFKD